MIGAKAPQAPSAPCAESVCQSSISEGGGFDADDPDHTESLRSIYLQIGKTV